MSQARQRLLKPILAAFLAVIVVASFGAFATQLGPWYYALKKPGWQPPDWLFGPAWTLIFGLAAVSGVSAWRNAKTRGERTRVIVGFTCNMMLNTFWSMLFFRLHRPDWALIEVGFLWSSILVVMALLWNLSHLASWLLVPYLLWVSFASFLNLAIVRLNAPFA
jgi:benzodiazapine receptor